MRRIRAVVTLRRLVLLASYLIYLGLLQLLSIVVDDLAPANFNAVANSLVWVSATGWGAGMFFTTLIKLQERWIIILGMVVTLVLAAASFKTTSLMLDVVPGMSTVALVVYGAAVAMFLLVSVLLGYHTPPKQPEATTQIAQF